MKKALSLLLALFLVISLMPRTAMAAEVSSGTCGDNLTWVIGDDETLTISGTGDMWDYNSKGTAPWYSERFLISNIVIEEGVTSIGVGAFYDCSLVSSVDIPNTVTRIGNGAFTFCNSLDSVEIGSNVTEIGSYVFRNCRSLTGIHVDENNPNYSSDEYGVLFDKNKTELITAPGIIEGTYTIPDSVTSITANAFYYCSLLESVEIPASVTSVGNYVFVFCDSLEGIVVDKNNPNYSSDKYGVLFNKDQSLLIRAPQMLEGEYTYDVYRLYYQIPSTVTQIESEAFYGCRYVYHIGIPASVIEIEDYAFNQCYAEYHVDEANPCYSSDADGFLFDKDKTLLIRAGIHYAEDFGDYAIPDGVIEIGDSAFDGTCLQSLEIPASVTNIGQNALACCANEITFLGNAPYIASDAFSGLVATAYYPSNNKTWTEDVLLDYGGNITWVGTTASTDPTPSDPSDPTDPDPVDPEPSPAENPFTDVSESAYYYKPVLWAVENNITGGTSATTFSPNASCTRGQIVTFLWAAAGRPEPTSSTNPFTDVKSSAYYYKAVLWAVENGITGGTSATTFSPNNPCTRGQVVTFLWAAKGRPEPESTSNTFSDVKASDYYCKAVLWAVENGITSGIGNGKFGPGNTCTRGQIVTFLYKAFA